MTKIEELEAALAAANASVPEWAEGTGKASHEFMRGKALPLTLWETSHVWHGDRLHRVDVSPIRVVKYDLSPGATTPTVEFKDTDGRRARGSVEMYYCTKEAAQAEADYVTATLAKEGAQANLIALMRNHLPALIEAAKALDAVRGALAGNPQVRVGNSTVHYAYHQAVSALEKLK